MIRRSGKKDFHRVLEIINDAAQKYKGRIPEDRWHDPYMPEEKLREEIEDGVQFWGHYSPDLDGVMGIQDRGDVALIRHAYVSTEKQRQGIGSELMKEIKEKTEKPLLVGTWKAATWAIDFYRKHGFRETDEETKNRLLKKYWRIPERQIETSTVLTEK